MTLFDFIRDYQRPIRTVIWTLLIVFIVMFRLSSGSSEEANYPLLEVIVIGMFADMGVYTAARSAEKIRQRRQERNNQEPEVILNGNDYSEDDSDIKHEENYSSERNYAVNQEFS